MPKVSVIIPVYEVEPYIERCVRSLMEQTLDDIEYIFIDDCSPDKSIEILQDVIAQYPKRKTTIIKHNVNKGLPEARKTGIKEATGDYIIHCDSDDYVESTMYEEMYSLAISHNYDIVVCDFYEITNNNKRILPGKNNQKSDIISDMLMTRVLGSLCNKMVSHNIVRNPSITYPIYNMAEDLTVALQYAILANSIGYTAHPLYYYCRRSSSILGQRDPQNMISKGIQFSKNFKTIIDIMSEQGILQKYQDEVIHECLFIKNHLLIAIKQGIGYSQWKEIFKEYNSKFLFVSTLTLKEKINFAVTYLGGYPLFCKFFRKLI